jgi:glucose/arabinose dehydrogenase
MRTISDLLPLLPLLPLATLACAGSTMATNDSSAGFVASPAAACDSANGGITLARGFCAAVAHDSLGRARHLTVAENGDVFVAVGNTRSERGGIVVLRDANADGALEEVARFGENGGTGIARRGEHLWFGTNDAVLRYRIPPGATQPAGAPDTIVQGLPSDRSHAAKSIAVTSDGVLFVNIGSPTNACQEKDREPGVQGVDPCPDLATRAGIWRFDANRAGQRQADGERFATGLRNVVALELGPDGQLYGAQHGRDQLHANWGAMFTEQQSAEKPSEEFVRVQRGDDYGWPYCYHDMELGRKVLAPEYGGDGRQVGRCSAAKMPLAAFPGHWAPNGLAFYTGAQFPARYRNGAFIAFHGSWNRSPLPQAGYKVMFVPMENGRVTGEPEVFADGFSGTATIQRSSDARFRPMDVEQAPDGGLYIIDSQKGRIWKVYWRGDEE